MKLKERWGWLSKKEKVFWVTIYIFVISIILLLGALLANIFGIVIG